MQPKIYTTAIQMMRYLPAALLLGCLAPSRTNAQDWDRPGRVIGKVSTKGHLIVLELDNGVLGQPNLFDLGGRTLRFTREGGGYRVETQSLHWDANFGNELKASGITLHNFSVPFSGKTWNSFSVDTTGSIRFDTSHGGAERGLRIRRFDQLTEAARRLVNTAPAICVFVKLRMSGTRYVKELADRVVITWDLTEPAGGIQDITWVKTTNRFQAVLWRNGTIEMSYKEIAAKDAIVGLYPLPTAGDRVQAVHFASLKTEDGPFTIAYEAFHYLALPYPQDLACSVIKALGDNFDFLAYYSDFRVDNQEAGTPSDGPLGGNVTGIGQSQHNLDRYCSAGRFQWQFNQPVYVGANQMQPRPPEGIETANDHDIDFYEPQLREASLTGQMPPYNYAISQLAHEMGHRWSAFATAKVNGETVVLGPTHWARGLQARVAFPYQRPTEASIMGGGVWQDNFNGTFTQLDDNYYVPATGYSYLDLYLMGLIAPSEVPDFFLLKNLVPAGRDQNGHPVFKADRVKVTIQDVIAAEGPRTPTVDHSQRKFNTGMVMVVEHGANPSSELIERTNGIREQWIDYWPRATGHRSDMTAEPH